MLLFHCSISSSFSQAFIYFLNKDRKICSQKDAVYTQKKVARALHGGFITDYGGTPGFTIFETTERFYPSGKLSLTTYNIEQPGNAFQLDCFDGETTWYYPNGNIKEKGFYSFGKKKGEYRYFDSNSKLSKTEYYDEGKLIDKNQFAVPSNSPMVGQWQYVYNDYVTYRFTQQFNSDGTSNYLIENLSVFKTWWKCVQYPKTYNWKYSASTGSTGTLEQFKGGEVVNRYTVQWTGQNSFTARLEYTTEYVYNTTGIYYFLRA